MKSGLSSPLTQGRRLANSMGECTRLGPTGNGILLDVEFEVLDLGKGGYDEILDLQRATLEQVHLGNRRSTLLLVEHPPVITLGAGFHDENLRLAREAYKAQGIEVRETDRGGDVTFHGPGQLVAYPIFDLQLIGKDLHRWLREMEQAVVVALKHWELEGSRNPINTGVWIGNKKVCAMGIKVRRWVSMHGLALNCDIDLAPFSLIVPCGIRGDYGVTSISRELGRPVTVEEAKPVLVEAFRVQFGQADEDRPKA